MLTVIIEISVYCKVEVFDALTHTIFRQERFALFLPQRRLVNMKLATRCEIFPVCTKGEVHLVSC